MERIQHPYQDCYESAIGANIEPDWLGKAVCRTTADSSWIFFPGRGEKLGDKEVCASCPVSGSCLMDAMTKSAKPVSGRRAGTTPADRGRIHSDLGQLVNFYAMGEGSTRQGRAEFYSNNPLAPALVRASMDWWDNYSFPDGERWPTEVAVTIAELVG